MAAETAAATEAVPVRVLDAWDETPSLRALRVAFPPEYAALHNAPGQVLRVRAGGPNDAYFAIASRPAALDGGTAELLVKRGSASAEAVLDAAARGEILSSGLVGAGFPVDKLDGQDALLFAAGSGIAPIRALVQHVVAHRRELGKVTLYYGQRDEAEFAYRKEHDAWERAGVRVFLCCTKPGPTWLGSAGRVQDVARSTSLDRIRPTRAVAFLAGMKGMVEGVREVLGAAGVPAERTFLNY